jgi:hypothetical protein
LVQRHDPYVLTNRKLPLSRGRLIALFMTCYWASYRSTRQDHLR